jgi:hypothetical protein
MSKFNSLHCQTFLTTLMNGKGILPNCKTQRGVCVMSALRQCNWCRTAIEFRHYICEQHEIRMP